MSTCVKFLDDLRNCAQKLVMWRAKVPPGDVEQSLFEKVTDLIIVCTGNSGKVGDKN